MHRSWPLIIDDFSPNMKEVLEKFDFDNTIKKLDEAGLLFQVAERFKTIDRLSRLPASTEISFLPVEAISEDGRLDIDEPRQLIEVWQGYTNFQDGDVIVAKITLCFEIGKGALCVCIRLSSLISRSHIHFEILGLPP
jgi:hypothetical protein